MKSEKWAGVRRGDFVIYADEWQGVFKAKVVELDIKIRSSAPPYVISTPYGLTKDTGTLRIEYDSKQSIMNLRDLIEYSAPRLWSLQQYWEKWQTKKIEADGLRTDFLSLIAELKA